MNGTDDEESSELGSPTKGAEEMEEDVAVILAALDTSTLASRVLDIASRVARRTWQNAQLHLLHVYRSTRFDRPASAGISTDDLMAEAQSYLDYHVRTARKQCPSPVQVTGHFASGDPVDEIVKLSRSLRADWVVVGTHDPVGLDRLLMGSVAEKVAKSAPCSVLVVRPKERPYVRVL